MGMLWSAKNNAFIPDGMVSQYQRAEWDLSDCIAVNEAVSAEFMGEAPANMMRVTGSDGMPAWAEIPPLTGSELLASFKMQKQALIDSANEHINERQWPGKAAIGRLQGDALAQYNIWLDYLEELEAVNLSEPEDVTWPEKPIV